MQNGRRAAENFIKYPPLWPLTKQLVYNGVVPRLSISVQRADAGGMDIRVYDSEKGRATFSSGTLNRELLGLFGARQTTVLAVSSQHKVLARLAKHPESEDKRVRDVLTGLSRPKRERVAYVAVVDQFRWYNLMEDDHPDARLMYCELIVIIIKPPLNDSWFSVLPLNG